VKPFDKERVLLVRPGLTDIRRERLLTLEAESALVESSHRQAQGTHDLGMLARIVGVERLARERIYSSRKRLDEFRRSRFVHDDSLLSVYG
jgi:hypothetical protein